MARVNEQRTTDVTRVLKAPCAELFQNACGVVKKQKIFCSDQCSPECSMNKFRAYIFTDTCFVLPRTPRTHIHIISKKNTSIYIYIYVIIYIYISSLYIYICVCMYIYIMLFYCFKCRKNTESKNAKISKANKGKLMLLSKFAMCDSNKARFFKTSKKMVDYQVA